MKFTATLLKYGEESAPDWFGDTAVFEPGALYTDDHQAVPVFIQHQDREGGAAARSLAIWTEGDLVKGEFELLDTPAGRQAATELGAGVRWDVSVGVAIDEFTLEPINPDSTDPWAPMRARAVSADLVETTLCLRGRMPSARVDSVSTDPVGSNA